MANTKKAFEYDYSTLLTLSHWSYARMQKDVSMGDLKPDNLVSVAAWLIANGKPWVRAKLISEALLSMGRAANSASPEALTLIFQQDEARRRVRSKNIARGKKAKT